MEDLFKIPDIKPHTDKEWSVDYGVGDKLVLYAINEEEHVYPDTLDAIFSSVPEGSTIFAEASFASYGIAEEYNNFLNECDRRNISLRKISNRAVKNFCLDSGIDPFFINQDDDRAVEIIGYIGKSKYETGRFYHRKFNEQISDDEIEKVIFEENLRRKIRVARNDGYPEAKAWLKLKNIPYNIGYAGAYEVAKFFKANAITDRNKFDKIVGLYALGRPSLFRANFHGYTKTGLDMWFKTKYKEKGQAHKNRKKNKLERKMALKELRSTSRKIFHLVINEI